MAMPKTCFSTPLSGSAKETETRIRNIFRRKKRPDIAALLIALALIPLCGSLVAFRARPQMPEIVMVTQYYDDERNNYIEIPTLSMPGGAEPSEGIAAINQALADLDAEYQPVLQLLSSYDQTNLTFYDNLCLFYPCVTSRYLNLVFFRNVFRTDLNTGHILTLVCDMETGRQVTLEDALALANTSEAELFARLSAQINPELDAEMAQYGFEAGAICVQNPVLEGFRIREDGTVVFYLTARVDDVDDTVADMISGADHIYIYQDETFSCYDQYDSLPLPALVPIAETEVLDLPLWHQRYSDAPPESNPPDPQDANRTAAYIAALEDLCLNLVFPDGRAYDAFDSDTSQDSFAIYDVDQDGKNELIVLCSNTYMAGMTGAIYGYDEATGTLFEKFGQFPALTFYDNGIIQAEASHNQGPAGDALWPYGLWRYDRESDRYAASGVADAWDKSLTEVYNEKSFPDEADKDGDGIVYYVGSYSEPSSGRYVDRAEYEQWRDSYLGGASVLDIPFTPMTEETILALRDS